MERIKLPSCSKSTLFNKNMIHEKMICFIQIEEVNSKMKVLKTFNINRSLSARKYLYGDTIAEATYEIIKIEFVFNKGVKRLEETELELFDYVN